MQAIDMPPARRAADGQPEVISSSPPVLVGDGMTRPAAATIHAAALNRVSSVPPLRLSHSFDNPAPAQQVASAPPGPDALLSVPVTAPAHELLSALAAAVIGVADTVGEQSRHHTTLLVPPGPGAGTVCSSSRGPQSASPQSAFKAPPTVSNAGAAAAASDAALLLPLQPRRPFQDMDVSVVYDIQQEIGKGAQGTVSLAVHRITGMRVAVKVLEKKPAGAVASSQSQSFLAAEVEAMQRLRGSVNVVSIIDVYESPPRVQIVMELLHGGELFDQLIDKGAYSEEEARTAMRSAALAVHEMHCAGVIHRDIKP